MADNGILAPYASRADRSRGRLYKETECPSRSPFQRDRDRVIHSSAFRRLTYKTQVFVYHEGDHYRTRLTHSLEVAQIARSIARILKLDEDLAEALALAHDLGHPPFGHAGERALNKVLAEHGGFDHNAQSLKTVTELERKYADFDGLNLTWETLEGLVKHNGPLINPQNQDQTSAIPSSVITYNANHNLELETFPSLEAQVASLADDIAYNNHDLDDGLRAALINVDMLSEIPFLHTFMSDIKKTHGDFEPARLIYEINRRSITLMINDVVAETKKRVRTYDPKTVTDIRLVTFPISGFSEEMAENLTQLRLFLRTHVYSHPKISAIMEGAESVVSDLFHRYLKDPKDLPAEWRQAATNANETEAARLVGDFVAGMTDRFALREHKRLFDATPELR